MATIKLAVAGATFIHFATNDTRPTYQLPQDTRVSVLDSNATWSRVRILSNVVIGGVELSGEDGVIATNELRP
jgi:hypothetical protein